MLALVRLGLFFWGLSMPRKGLACGACGGPRAATKPFLRLGPYTAFCPPFPAAWCDAGAHLLNTNAKATTTTTTQTWWGQLLVLFCFSFSNCLTWVMHTTTKSSTCAAGTARALRFGVFTLLFFLSLSPVLKTPPFLSFPLHNSFWVAGWHPWYLEKRARSCAAAPLTLFARRSGGPSFARGRTSYL